MTTAAPVPQASASIVWMHSVAPPRAEQRPPGPVEARELLLERQKRPLRVVEAVRALHLGDVPGQQRGKFVRPRTLVPGHVETGHVLFDVIPYGVVQRRFHSCFSFLLRCPSAPFSAIAWSTIRALTGRYT